MFIPNIPGE